MPISPETLDRLQSLAVEVTDDERKTWERIVFVGSSLEEYPPKSHDRKELSLLIAQTLKTKSATQRVYARIWRVLTANPNGVRIPFNLHPSTVRALCDHGAKWQDVATADEEGWTLAQARLWAQGRVVEKGEKPVTLWKHLTRTIPPEWRKRERLGYDDLGEFVGLVRDATRDFTYEGAPKVTKQEAR